MPPHQSRSLIVMRHAKAEPFAAEDELRKLTPVGAAAAAGAGEWLRARGLVPDHAWVSAATRTRETWAAVEGQLASGIEPQVDPSLYGAGPESLVDLLGLTPAEAMTTIVVGHNPTVAYLSHLLDDGHPDPEAWQRVSAGFPTAALAVFDVPVEWADLTLGSAHLRAFHVGGHGD
ncbi:MAG: histidine phosphatase family protein [Myxococcales bacterium]|nr:MAG: histidine phosphatase family protein [Myxococcales bacterium]